MKNFLQFVVPILVILVIGIIMLLNNKVTDDTKRLYIKCNSISKNFEVFTGIKLYFAEGNEKCELDIEVVNVDRNFIKINTDYLWPIDNNGKIDKTEANQTNIIQINKEVTLYSYDEQIKYIFVFK